MKSILKHCAVVLSLACSLPAAAHQEIFLVTLNGSSEAPANVSPGIGDATVTFDLDLVTMRVEATFSGLTGNVSASHIHCCTANPGAATAGVASQTPSFTGFPTGVTAGTYDHTFDLTQAGSYNAAFITNNGGTVSTALNALLAGAATGKAYLNIHTSTFPGGEIRGFLTPAPVPVPAAVWLMGSALVGLLGLRRKRAI
ncbi:MAG: CHRD domain-containing protein [Candidatus Methylumidiphilus sp.]